MKLPDYLTKKRITDERFSVFFKWSTLNLLGFFLLIAAYYQGLVHEVLAADSTNIVVVIFGLMLFAILSSGVNAFSISKGKLTSSKNIKYLKLLGSTAVMLGLIGTVLGIIVALQAVQVEAVGNVNEVGNLVAGLAQGMGIALYTTLVGGVAAMVIGFNHFILMRGIESLTSVPKVEKQNV